jgi:PAS domain S-box-containing protein
MEMNTQPNTPGARRPNAPISGERIDTATGLARYMDLQQGREGTRQNDGDIQWAVDSIPSPAWSTIADGSSQVFNKPWHHYTGLSPSEAMNGGWQASFHPDDFAKVAEKWLDGLASGESREIKARVRRFDGEYRCFLVRTTPQRNEAGDIIGWCGVYTDVDEFEQELQRAAAGLRKAQAELAHATRVTMMGELAASIAHEVNQPIAAVLLNCNACLHWLEKVSEDPANTTEARETLHRIIRDGKRAGNIIANIRTLFKKTESTREPLDINKAIREIIVLAKAEMDAHRVVLRLELGDDLPPVQGDGVQLQQVILNLVLNAIDAVSTVEGRSRDIVIRTKRLEKGEVMVTVRDSGIGLDASSMEKMFTAFHTTKPGGLGMGLSISRSIVENHDGRLWATADEGPGASFHFTLLTAVSTEPKSPRRKKQT